MITQLRRQDEIFVPRVRARVYKHVLNVNREENYRCIAQERRRREQQRKANRTWQKLLHSLTNERGAWGSKSALGVSSASTSMGYKGTSTHHEGGDKELGASVASAADGGGQMTAVRGGGGAGMAGGAEGGDGRPDDSERVCWKLDRTEDRFRRRMKLVRKFRGKAHLADAEWHQRKQDFDTFNAENGISGLTMHGGGKRKSKSKSKDKKAIKASKATAVAYAKASDPLLLSPPVQKKKGLGDDGEEGEDGEEGGEGGEEGGPNTEVDLNNLFNELRGVAALGSDLRRFAAAGATEVGDSMDPMEGGGPESGGVVAGDVLGDMNMMGGMAGMGGYEGGYDANGEPIPIDNLMRDPNDRLYYGRSGTVVGMAAVEAAAAAAEQRGRGPMVWECECITPMIATPGHLVLTEYGELQFIPKVEAAAAAAVEKDRESSSSSSGTSGSEWGGADRTTEKIPIGATKMNKKRQWAIDHGLTHPGKTVRLLDC